jgi:hypothetical protein
MGIKEEIFEEFFTKLEKDSAPAHIIKGLKDLLDKGEMTSKEKILELVMEGPEDDVKN